MGVCSVLFAPFGLRSDNFSFSYVQQQEQQKAAHKIELRRERGKGLRGRGRGWQNKSTHTHTRSWQTKRVQLKNAFTIVLQFVAFICSLHCCCCSCCTPCCCSCVASCSQFFFFFAFWHSLLPLFCYIDKEKQATEMANCKENERKTILANCLWGGACQKGCREGRGVVEGARMGFATGQEERQRKGQGRAGASTR